MMSLLLKLLGGKNLKGRAMDASRVERYVCSKPLCVLFGKTKKRHTSFAGVVRCQFYVAYFCFCLRQPNNTSLPMQDGSTTTPRVRPYTYSRRRTSPWPRLPPLLLFFVNLDEYGSAAWSPRRERCDRDLFIVAQWLWRGDDPP
mmetsp:Transcript_49693/g.105651  ORF Transcript_49693/g.105651 Transcript_49693/m.105651 type:complete len:144 (-) Transcript_49693:364-795(-)